MKLHIDRALPVPLGRQLRGVIEYGIACGELAPGTRLPSVRELAGELGIAPMTVSQVYKALKSEGLVDTISGSGTFICQRTKQEPRDNQRATVLRNRIDKLIDDGLALGFGPSELTGLFGARVALRAEPRRSLRLLLTGIFTHATRAYAEAVAQRLPPGDEIEATTLDELKTKPVHRRQAAAADLVICFANRLAEVAELLPENQIVALSFIPSEPTRTALAGLDPLARLGVVSVFPEFLPIMMSGIQRFAPHVADISAALLDQQDLPNQLAGRDVIVYATGAEALVGAFAPGVRYIEYRHTPDPADIERNLLPLLEELRQPEPNFTDTAVVSEENL